MTDHKQNPAEIYLVPMLGDDHDHIWSEDPAPGEGMREEDATRYVRADLVPESNAVLANSIAELTRKNSELMAKVEQLQRTTFDVVCASAILGVPIHEEESHKCLSARDAEVAAKAVSKFVSDTNETGQFSWSDYQWLEDWRDEWLEQQAEGGE